ncbi:C1 family peptidase [Candidatus Viridilinea mediisalina]|uniref:Peptidase C1A papain C-terminal domain-containing protein n=1 Tax=Candidatus Viridilinea mediisalina TaxID=2024553 RepID=A0A2A6RLB3_9CHLR|nr:C1 family peptidase [Candidatus Viridilinea mediisalina]PDW03723.1 hypothetical protein CJ255_07395 [Candidatus Viridilinea mediisalina]
MALHPLDQISAIPAALRKRLAEEYWITSVEELIATARSSNAQYGSGLAALALALGMSEANLRALVEFVRQQSPPEALSFSVPVSIEHGSGLVLGDYRNPDAAAFSIPTSLPAEVPPLGDLPPPGDQGVRNTCVAFALAASFQVVSQAPTPLSEQFLYWACKEVDGVPGDHGTLPLVAFEVLRETGICLAETWPYAPSPRDHDNPGHGPPPPEAQSEAPLRRVERFHPLPPNNINVLKDVIAKGWPILVGLDIREHWEDSWQATHLGRLRPALPGERDRGGHALCLLGYRNDPSAPGGGYFIARNSWGATWANGNSDGPGLCHVPYRLMHSNGLLALALERVRVATPPPRPPDASVGKAGQAAQAAPDLAQLYAEAKELHTRMGLLVERLAGLLDPSAAPRPNPAPAALPDQAERTSAPSRPAASGAAQALKRGASGPLVLLSGAQGSAGEQLYPNGLMPEGKPLLQIDAATAARLAQGKAGQESREHQSLYRNKAYYATNHFAGTIAEVDPSWVETARWAVVINATEPASLLKAIWPLIEHRMRQMGHATPKVDFREGETAGAWYQRHTNAGSLTLQRKDWGRVPPVLIYTPGERAGSWLARHKVGQGPVDPARGVPYYLLLLGRPGPLHDQDQAYIPLSFQYDLDFFWAVGRLCFSDELGQHRLVDYTTYAERLVGFEQLGDAAAAARLRPEVAYVGTRHDMDMATERSADELVRPLAEWSSTADALPQQRGIGHQLLLGATATRNNFERLLSGGSDGRPPAILFTACHGLGLPLNHTDLLMHQGSLVMADWSGIGNVSRDHWFAAEDLGNLSGGPKLEGSFVCLFACYGAGCPDYDEFIFDASMERPRIAPFPLIAQLPQQLLLNGALGVLGHVERAWTYSFSSTEGARAQTQGFEDIIGRLLQGRPLGDATDQFNTLQGQRAMMLTEELNNIKFNKQVEPLELAQLWVARNDARNYIVLGDPAARLPYERPERLLT